MLNVNFIHWKDRENFDSFAVFRTFIDELKFSESDGVDLDLPNGKTLDFFMLGVMIPRGDN